MDESRKRSHKDRGDTKNQKRRMERDEKDGRELVVYRILCPDNVIGSVIGRGGKVINTVRHETKAWVKVVDPFPGAKHRVITIYCYVKEKEGVAVDKESNDSEPLCAAQYALLRMHAEITNAVASVGESDRKQNDREECQLLVPSSQSANVIGKSGSTIKKLRNNTGTNIKITAKDASDPTHSCAFEFDNFVLISGDSEAVKKALFAVSAIIYKSKAKEDIPLDTTVPEIQPSIIIPSDIPMFPAAGIYPGEDRIVPSGHVSSVLGPAYLGELSSYADGGGTWPVYSSTLPVFLGHSGTSRTKELTIRLLCPSNNIGRVIGKGGNSVKSVRQASGAHIEVDNVKAGHDECIITIISTESIDDLKSMAVEAVLLLQGKINDEGEDNVTIRLLVPSRVIGRIIGKSGSIINEIRKRTKADVRVSKGKKPKCADANDELVEVIGEVSNVRDALIQVVLRLRDDVLKDQNGGHYPPSSAEPLQAGGTGLPVPSILPSISPVAPLSYEQRTEAGPAIGMLSSNNHYGDRSLSIGDNSYGLLSSYSSKVYGSLPPPSTLEVVIPAHAVGKVMGKGGNNIENMQKISGASIVITNFKSYRGDRVALISGTPDQKRAAENLIKAFIMAT